MSTMALSSLNKLAKRLLPKYLPTKLYDVLVDKCNRNEVFLTRYLYNAVLSFIEKEEEKKIRNMNFEDWILIRYKDLKEHIKEYIRRLLRACNQPEDLISTLDDANLRELVIDAIAYLSYYGPTIDEVARLLIIKDFEAKSDFEEQRKKIMEQLDSGNLYVRSLFIELASYLIKLKQRFPDRSAFQSPRLVDRVFAYVEPRELPLDIEDIDELRDMLKSLTTKLYKIFVSILEKQRCLTPKIDENFASKVGDLVDRYVDLMSKFLPRLYRYQYRGIREALVQVISSLELGKLTKKVILLNAPTGSGKTEVFVITSIITAIAHRLATMTFKGIDLRGPRAPLALILYPRRSLATDQLRRIIKHVYTVNKAANEVLQLRDPLLRLSINYTEVRGKKEFREELEKHVKSSLQKGYLKLKYVQVPFEHKGDRIIVYVPLLKCPVCEQDYLSFEYDVDKKEVIERFKRLKCQKCGENIDFISFTKEDVYDAPGDIHVSLAETLRMDLIKSKSIKLFGNRIDYGALIIVLDEVHMLTGVHGARVAYLLGRVIERVRRTTGIMQRPIVFIALSATIPQTAKQGFIPKFFKVDPRNVVILEPLKDELIPSGNEYFFITIPTTSELVDNLTVSIQTIMALHCNMPSYTKSSPVSKRSFVFVDNLDTIKRLKDDLSDAMFRETLIENVKGGLQDLRNPLHQAFKEITLREYGDQGRAWKDGELWHPYIFEYALAYSLKSENLKMAYPVVKIGVYTSRQRDPIDKLDIVVTDSALEVGVDYDNVAVIYQHGMPLTIASLIQRSGRGGRIVRENPLIRMVVAAQLSPYMPSQAAFLERLVREESLRKLIEYEYYDIPLRSPKIIEQVIAEIALDYLAFLKSKSLKDLRSSYPLIIKGDFIHNFINEEYLGILHNNEFREYLMRALIEVGPLQLNERETIESILDKMLNEILVEVKESGKEGG